MKNAIFDHKNINFWFNCNFKKNLVIKTLDPELDPDLQLEQNAGSGSRSGYALNQYRSETLLF